MLRLKQGKYKAYESPPKMVTRGIKSKRPRHNETIADAATQQINHASQTHAIPPLQFCHCGGRRQEEGTPAVLRGVGHIVHLAVVKRAGL